MLQIIALAPSSLAATPLVEEAMRENFLFLDRLLKSATTGEPLFTAAGEIFLGAYVDDELAGVGGISQDPYGAPASTGRLRHLYVRRQWRRRNIGGSLVHALLDHSRTYFRKVRLRTDTETAAAFYDAIGFRRTRDPCATHFMDL